MLQLRQHGGDAHLREAALHLRRTFGRNFRFWLFTWPVLRLPIPLAAAWTRLGQGINRALRLTHHPADTLLKLSSRLRRQ